MAALKAETESIAATSALFLTDTERKMEMTKAQMYSEFDYRVSIGILKDLLSNGLLTKAEFEKAKRLLLQKYAPIISSLGD